MTMPLGANLLPWLRGRELARLDRMLGYFLLLNQIRRSQITTFAQKVTRFLIQAPIRWRLDSSFFSFPWEMWLAKLSQPVVKRRSLVTGQALPVEPANVC
jgi:anaerobic magnesium-protoporphyrin IX monomethyl ester cyclase